MSAETQTIRSLSIGSSREVKSCFSKCDPPDDAIPSAISPRRHEIDRQLRPFRLPILKPRERCAGSSWDLPQFPPRFAVG
jgi:hypothetical protein